MHITISPSQALRWETSIANAEINRMERNIFITRNTCKGLLPMQRIDNFDVLEDKITTHAFQVIQVFHQWRCEFTQFAADRKYFSYFMRELRKKH